MAGGENFERKPLNFSGTTLTRSKVKKDINDFKRDYLKYSRFFSNKAEMKKILSSNAYEFYQKKCEYWQLDKCLVSLHKIVASMPWLTDDDCVDLIRAIDADPKGQKNDFGSYAEFQNILSNIEKHIGSFGRITGDTKDKMFAIRLAIGEFALATVRGMPQSIFNYLASSYHLADYLHDTLRVCKDLKLL